MDHTKLFAKYKTIGDLNTDDENLEWRYRNGFYQRKMFHADHEKSK